MARRRASQDAGSSSPNTVLVVFLVLFILTTLGLGGWVYSIFGERRKADEAGRLAAAKEIAAKENEAWGRYQALEMRAMLGDPVFRDDKTDEHKAWKELRDDFVEAGAGAEPKFKEDTKFKNAPKEEKEAMKAWVTAAYKDLKWNDKTYSYATNYREEIKKYRDEAVKYRADAYQQLARANAEEEKYRSLDAQYRATRDAQMAAIKASGTAQLKAIEAKSESMEAAIAQNQDLRTKLTGLQTAFESHKTQTGAEIKKLKAQVAAATGAPVQVQEKTAKAEREVQAHALFLDISKGRPLWDRPRGKIIRVDEKERKVYIDRGADEGVTVGLTFNVFGAGWDNRAEGPFKGTIEVVRVEARTAAARITSLYDREGNEISLNDPSPNKFQRESNNAMKEGDLLFNLAWGTHVVVAGVVDWSGRGPQSAEAQGEELDQFLRVVRSQGVTVDAYIDLRDGQVRGNFTPKTAFLVRGFGVPGKDKDDGRAKAVNDSIETLRKATLERGLFVISPENFLNVIGYRRPRSRTDTDLTGFRPGQPFGGALLAGATAGAEGGKLGEGALADLTGKWGGKMAGGGVLRLSFKGDGGCVWQVVLGAEKTTGYAPVVQAGKDFTVTIQGRPATLRLVSAGQTLQVTGANVDAALKRE